MEDRDLKYVLGQLQAQDVILSLLFDLLARERPELARELLEDVELLGQRAGPDHARFLLDAAADWRQTYEALQRLAQHGGPAAPGPD
jgi:hypothetical protein